MKRRNRKSVYIAMVAALTAASLSGCLTVKLEVKAKETPVAEQTVQETRVPAESTTAKEYYLESEMAVPSDGLESGVGSETSVKTEHQKMADGAEPSREVTTPEKTTLAAETGEQTPASGKNGSAQNAWAQAITIDAARKLVAERIPGINVNSIYIKEDYDDGRYLYEGEAFFEQTEYEFEIEPFSGNFLEWSVERKR